MIEVGVVGGTGYTGVELLRLLAAHPDVGLFGFPETRALDQLAMFP